MVVENPNEMLQGSDSNSHSTDKKVSNNVNQKTWMKLIGPAPGPLGDFLVGSRVVVWPEIMTAGKEENNVSDQEVNKSSGTQTVKEYSVKVDVLSTANTPPRQETKSGDAQMAEATPGVKPEAVPPSSVVIAGTPGPKKIFKVLRACRIVLLGKTGSGKSSLGNSIFGQDTFKLCGTNKCQIQSKSVHERRITLVDTPDFSDTDQPEEHLKDEILRCTAECATGPHAFLIVLKVEESTEQQLVVIDKIKQYFSEEFFKYAAVVFTHGDQLHEGVNIEQYISQNTGLSDLVKKCSDRYNVVNNKCKLESDDNQLQMSKILNTVDKIVMENKGGCYIHKMPEVQKREKSTLEGKQPQEDKDDGPHKNVWVSLSGPAGISVAEAFFGPTVTAWQNTIRVPVNEEHKTTDEKQEENEEREPKTESEPEEAPQNKTENETKQNRQYEKQNNGNQVDKTEHRQDVSKNGSWGLFGRVLSWVGASLAALAGGAAGAALAALAAGASGVVLAAGATVGALALAVMAGLGYLAGAGSVMGAVTLVGMWIKNKIQPLINLYYTTTENLGVILLVVAVFLLLVLSFFLRVPMAVSFLLSGGIVVLFLLIMLLLAGFMQ